MENESMKGEHGYGRVFCNRHGDPCLLPKTLVNEGVLPDVVNSEDSKCFINNWLLEGYTPGVVGSDTVLLYVRFEDGMIQMAATECSDIEGLTVGQIQTIIESGAGTAKSVLEDLRSNFRDVSDFEDKVFLMDRKPYSLLLPDGIADSSKNTMLIILDKNTYLSADWQDAFMECNSGSVSYNLDLFNQDLNYRNTILQFCDEYKTGVFLHGKKSKVKRLSYDEIDKKPAGFILTLLVILIFVLLLVIIV